MLIPKTNVGKLKNGVFTIKFPYFKIAAKLNKNLYSNVLRITNWYKSIQNHIIVVEGSSLTSIYAVRITIVFKR